MPRYRFADFILSPRQRTLVRAGTELRLIPRYFDLLVFLVERRGDAVHRRDIFDRVWSDVVVSDTALSQAIRTLRRTLGDDPREPTFIRTVARHGYRFVCADVVEEDDAAPLAAAPVLAAPAPADDAFEPLLTRITREPASAAEEEDQRDAAERLHALGTNAALERLGTRPGHEHARALLRDTRWDVPGAAPVPLVGEPGTAGAARHLIRLRLRRGARAAAARGAAATLGGGLAGAIGGLAGGALLILSPQSAAHAAVIPVLGGIGGFCGAAGAAGVAGGMSIAESIARSGRTLVVAIGGGAGGAVVGYAAQWFSRWSLAAVVGIDLPIGGGIEGLALGTAAGLGYSAATRLPGGGLAAPRGKQRLRTAIVTATACAIAALLLTAAGRPMVGGTVHAIAQASGGSQAVLTPLGRLVGDPEFGQLTRAVIALGEGAFFGFGLALGLTRRPPV
ncbi:MAG TPA: transcriptional regulator [Vicinamibacterales bacterium]